jgi:hypothetical protein
LISDLRTRKTAMPQRWCRALALVLDADLRIKALDPGLDEKRTPR